MLDLLGKKFNRLTPLGYMEKSMWRCECDCGNLCTVSAHNIASGRTKSCGCLQKEVLHNINSKAPGVSAASHVYLQYRAGAKNRGYEFKLTKEQILELVKQPCHYCGIEPSNVRTTGWNSGSITCNGIDRVDNSIGYTKENVVPCCWTCNNKKKAMSKNEFLEWVSRVYTYQNSIKVSIPDK